MDIDAHPSSTKPWFARWSIALSIFGTIIVGILSNFLTDYVKLWLSQYSAGLRTEQLHKLQYELDLIDKLHASTGFYVTYISEIAIKAAILSTVLGIISALYTFSFNIGSIFRRLYIFNFIKYLQIPI